MNFRKLTFNQQIEIYTLWRNGVSQTAIAQMHGVSRRTVGRVIESTRVKLFAQASMLNEQLKSGQNAQNANYNKSNKKVTLYSRIHSFFSFLRK